MLRRYGLWSGPHCIAPPAPAHPACRRHAHGDPVMINARTRRDMNPPERTARNRSLRMPRITRRERSGTDLKTTVRPDLRLRCFGPCYRSAPRRRLGAARNNLRLAGV